MNLSLPSNISKLRKEHSMTQEQLAEALGVTFASVSKWERGVATPELNLIAEMANLFEVSLDALVGFEVMNGGVAAIEERIHNLQRQKKYDEAVLEKTFGRECYDGDGQILWADINYEIVIPFVGDNFDDDFLREKNVETGFEIIKKKMETTTAASTFVKSDNERCFLFVSEVKKYGIYAVGVVPEDTVSDGITYITSLVLWVFGLLLVLFMIITIYLFAH